jgi:threonine synthase
VLDPDGIAFPEGSESNPFLRYSGLFHSRHLWEHHERPAEDYRRLVAELDDRIATVDGHGFTATPFGRSDALSDRLGFSPRGGVWVKDETGNVSGSHKGRHLMGLLIHLRVVEALGLIEPGVRPRLVIASCGNAALAAAVLAAAEGLRLDVFVPEEAARGIVDRLRDFGVTVIRCVREPGRRGDPAFLRMLQALDDGAIPFTCQGNVNGLAIEGGQTLAYEMASSLRDTGADLDRLIVQVGGGALASACGQGMREAHQLGVIGRRPRTDTVQTRAVFPLRRAFERVARDLGPNPSPRDVEDGLRDAARHRSRYMWPWENPSASVAAGILDDETYDWLAAVRAMLETGGQALVVDDDLLLRANGLAREATGIDMDPTGSAGLAGLLATVEDGLVTPDDLVGVLFTGARRPTEA